MKTANVTTRTAHYEVKTVNSTYYVRFIPGQYDWRFQERPDRIEAWGHNKRFEIFQLPQCGIQMSGAGFYKYFRSTKVQSIRKINRKTFSNAIRR
jgi:hypothetical protein